MSNIPAYMSIRQYIVDLVMDHHNADIRIMSERELCRKFSVSRTTVRNALHDLLADGWLYTRPGLGMFIQAERVKNNAFAICKSYKILIILGDGKYAYLDGFHMKLLAGIFTKLGPLPVRLRLVNLAGAHGEVLEELKMHNADGIIWIRPVTEMTPAIQAIRENAPVYVVGNVAEGDDSSVTMDYYQAGHLAAAWFLDQDRKNVIFTGRSEGGSAKDESFGVKDEVFRGWEDEYIARGLTYNRKFCLKMTDDIVKKAQTLLSKKQAEGVFTFGSEFPAIDLAMTQTGKTSAEECPLMLDYDFGHMFNTHVTPTVKLIMLGPEIAEIAAEALFSRLSEPGFLPHEIVLEPRIEAMQIEKVLTPTEG